MRPETWVRVRELYEHAQQLPQHERAPFIHGADDDPEIVGEVQRMLAAEERLHERFLEPVVSPQLEELVEELGAAATPLAAGTRFGAYEILDVIASGGMGTVYRARQHQPSRIVALKTLRAGTTSESRFKRFRLEAEVLGRLHHPGIAQIYEAGMEGAAAVPFFAMELVQDARDIVSYCEAQRLDESERLRLFLQVCDAVHHGHQKGVIHRDLKPSNVLVDDTGHPKVIDFGLARTLDVTTQVSVVETQEGELLGTLQYMSPEQISGGADEIDTRTDVYALGVILYELLTERLPYEVSGSSIHDLLTSVRNAEPRPPLELPSDLAWVLLKALEKDPARRYASASEFAADLRRYTQNESVLAGAPSVTYRVKKFARRHRLLLATVAGVIASLGFGLVRAAAEAAEAKRQEIKAVDFSRFLRRTLTATDPFKDGDELLASDLLSGAAESLEWESAMESETEAHIHNIIGESYVAMRRFELADRHISLAEEYVEAHLPDSAPFAIDVSVNRSLYLMITAQHTTAIELLRDVEPRALRVLGPDHEVTLRAQCLLAEALMTMGEYDESEERFEAVIPVLERVYGKDHPEVIGASGGRALVWSHGADRFSGRERDTEAKRALEEMKRVLALAEEALPADHFRIWNARLNLGTALFEAGEPEESVPLFEAVLGMVLERFGAEHPFAAFCFANVGKALRELGDPRAALPHADRALAAAEMHWGNESPMTADLRADRVRSHLADCRPRVAEAFALEALAAREGAGWEDRNRIELLQLLSDSLWDQGRSDEAREVLATAYEGCEADRSAAHVHRLRRRLAEIDAQLVTR